MAFSLRTILASACASLPCLMLAGCSLNQFSSPSTGVAAASSIKGRLHGGQQPVTGATIQLYAASMTANAGASTPLLTTPVTTDSTGSFNITGDYTCPASNPLVYIVATGGNPGLPGTVNNNALAMMSLLGTCNTIFANAQFTFIWIDELTTVASVQAVAPFMTDYAHIGQAPSNPIALAGAFESATSEVDFSTGQFGGGGANESLPEVTINTVADIIGSCVNTIGGSAGNGSPCGNLLSLTGNAPDTVSAALHIVQSPGQNTASLYNLIPASPPFQPYYTTVPTDFTATVGFTAPAGIQTGALDSNGHLWLYTGGYSYNTVTDTSTDIAGVITVYDNNFNQMFTISPGTGGLYYPSDMAADASGHVFTINSNNTVSEFNSNGSAVSPAAGWSTGFVPAFTGTSSGNGYVSNYNQAGPITIDAQGNIWGGVPYGSSSCYFEMNSSGTVITPAGNFCTMAGFTFSSVETAATDGSGNAWALGNTSIAKVNSAGNFVISAPLSQGCFYPFSSVQGSSNPTQAYESATNEIRYDHVHNQLWGVSETGAGAITDAGAAVFCDFGSTILPVSPVSTTASTTPGAAFSSGSILLTSGVLDGAGNLWFTTGGTSVSGVVGSAPSTFTGTVTYNTYLGEISSSGVLQTPYNASANSFGLQPTGLGTNATATATNAGVSPYGDSVGLIGVDVFGNIWAEDISTNKILKITGLATANTVNY